MHAWSDTGRTGREAGGGFSVTAAENIGSLLEAETRPSCNWPTAGKLDRFQLQISARTRALERSSIPSRGLEPQGAGATLSKRCRWDEPRSPLHTWSGRFSYDAGRPRAPDLLLKVWNR